MVLRDEVYLSIAAAERQIDALGAKLAATAAGFRTQVDTALSAVKVGDVDVHAVVTADTTGFITEVQQALDNAVFLITVGADLSTLETELAEVEPSPVEVPVTADFVDFTEGYEAAFAELDPIYEVQLDFDTTGFIQGYNDAMSEALGISQETLDIISGEWAEGVHTQVEVDTADAVRSMQNLSDATDAYSKEVDNAEQQVARFSTSMKLMTLAAVGFVTGVGAVGLSYNRLVARVNAGFETLLGSARSAQTMMDELLEFATSSPFPRQVFLQSTQELLGMGVAARDVVPMLQAVQDAMLAMGKGADDVSRILTVLGQVQSTGQFTALTFQQLALRGVDAAALIGDAFGKTGAQIREDISAGVISAEEALTALTVAMEERYAGAAANIKAGADGAADSVKGALRDLGALLTSWLVDASGGGAFADIGYQISGGIRQLIKELEPAVEIFRDEFGPAITTMAERVIPVFVDGLTGAVPAMAGFGQAITWLAELFGLIGAVVGLLPQELLGMITVFGALTVAVTTLGVAWQLMAAKIKAANITLAASNPILLGLAGAATMLATMLGSTGDQARQAASQVKDFRGELERGIPVVEVYTNLLSEGLDNRRFRQAFEQMGLTFDEFVEDIQNGGVLIELGLDQISDKFDRIGMTVGVTSIVKNMDQAGETALAAAVATEEFTQAQVDTAVAVAQATASLTPMADAYAALRAETDDLAERQQALADRVQEIIDPFNRARAALNQIRGVSPLAADALRGLSIEASRSDRTFLDFAVAAEDAGLSAEQMAAAAAFLGVTIADLEAGVALATGALHDFSSAAISALPTVSSVFDSLSKTSAAAGGSVPASMSRAADSTARFTKALEDANKALREALEPATSVDLERAELGVERSLTQQAAAAARVRDAEEALRNARWDAADQGRSLIDLEDDRRRALREAQLSVREAALAEIDARRRLDEVQRQGSETDEKVIAAREKVATVEQQAAEAAETAARSGARTAAVGRGNAQATVITAQMFTDALLDQAHALEVWQTDLETIADAGFADIAGTLAKQGPETAGVVAAEIANALKAGNREMAESLSGAINEFETRWGSAARMIKSRLGPEFILQMGLAGEGAALAFGDGFDLAGTIHESLIIAESGVSAEAAAMARIWGSVGQQSADEYARLFDLDERTRKEAEKLARRLGSLDFATESKAAGSTISRGIMEGINEGFDTSMEETVRKAAELAEAILRTQKRALKIKSPSEAARDEIAGQYVAGLTGGLDRGIVEVTAAAKRLADAALPGLSVVSALQEGQTIQTPRAALQPAAQAPSVVQAPLVNELRIYASDPEAGMRAALTDLESVARRGR